MHSVGDIVQLSPRVPDNDLVGFLAIIEKVYVPHFMDYAYHIRFLDINNFTEHRTGDVKASWVNKI